MRLDFEARFSNPPAPVLQATGLFKGRVARNEAGHLWASTPQNGGCFCNVIQGMDLVYSETKSGISAYCLRVSSDIPKGTSNLKPT